MSRQRGQSGDGTSTSRGTVRLFGTIAVALALALATSLGYAGVTFVGVAQQDQQEDTSMQPGAPANYAVQQGENCLEAVAISSQESVQEFYDYRTPLPDNEYTNATGQSFSSEGTTDLQVPNESVLFVHQGPTRNLSLVSVHGALNETSQGGAASFDLSGLSENGTWAVRDDEYDGENSVDNWSHEDGNASIDWTWGEARTDGFAFAGPGENFTVTIDPAFNENASLYGEYYDGLVENWTVVSNDTSAGVETALDDTYDRIDLDRTENVTISTEPCPIDTQAPDEAGDDTSDETTAGDDAAGDGDSGVGGTVGGGAPEPDDGASEPGDDSDGEDGTAEAGDDDGGEEDDGEEAGDDDGIDEDDGEEAGDDGGEGDVGDDEQSTNGENASAEDGDEDAATGGNSPRVNSLVWDRVGSSDDFLVDWAVSDPDGDLSDVTVELRDGSSALDSNGAIVSGTSEVGDTELTATGPDSVQVTVTDSNGNQGTDSLEIGPPPSDDLEASADSDEAPDDSSEAPGDSSEAPDNSSEVPGDDAQGDDGADVTGADAEDETNEDEQQGEDAGSDENQADGSTTNEQDGDPDDDDGDESAGEDTVDDETADENSDDGGNDTDGAE